MTLAKEIDELREEVLTLQKSHIKLQAEIYGQSAEHKETEK